MYELSDIELSAYIKDDLPYFDLTTSLQTDTKQMATLEIFTREDIVVSCSEEATKIAQMLGCSVDMYIASGERLEKNNTIIAIKGKYYKLHQVWRLVQILLEYSCKIATTTNNMINKISQINPKCALLTTRKTFPFSKNFCIKSIIVGGALPHRLGLSDSILFFDNHKILYKNKSDFYNAIKEIKYKIPEKKIVVECESFDEAKELLANGVDVLQIDKADFDTLKEIVSYKNQNYNTTHIISAGGININNVQEYVKTGIDGVVTSSLYNSGMANLGSKMILDNK